ncbi:MAG: GAF domain-containing protein, partial [candidate division NC10 bacterium]
MALLKEGNHPFCGRIEATVSEDGQECRAAVVDITERKRAEERLLMRTRELEAVHAVTAEIARELDLATLLNLITRRAGELIGAESSTVWLWNEVDQVLTPGAWYGFGDWMKEWRLRLGEGVSGVVAERRQGLLVNDYNASPYTQPLVLGHTEITAMLAEPLLYRDKLLGVIRIAHQGGRLFTEEDRRLLNLFAAQAAITIENARLFSAVERRAVELNILREVDHTIISRLELPVVLEAVVAGALRLLGNPFAQLILWDEATQRLRFGAALGPEAERVRAQTFELGRGINGVVAQTRQPMILDDYQASPYVVPGCADIVATITVPIL